MNVTLLKSAVVVVNVVLLICGIVVAALGIWVLAVDYGIVKLSKIKEDGFYSSTLEEPGLLESAAVICIAVGVAMIILSIIIFCGVRKESKCYMALVSLLLLSV
ncbi:hypothetical protein BsWGS_24646 [Bradybaena similaris]